MANETVRIAVVSDTHGMPGTAERIAAAAGRVDRLFHLGDHAGEADAIAAALGCTDISRVRGNCDGRYDGELSEVVHILGHKLMLTHGHAYYVKHSLLRISLAAEEIGAEAVLFGHTHTSGIEFAGAVTLINPGSASLPRTGRPSFAVLEITKERIAPQIIYI